MKPKSLSSPGSRDSVDVSHDRAQLLKLYEQMVLLRRFELAVQDLYKNGKLPGFVHLYVGQEAVAVGVCAHLHQTDWITSTHRGHGHALAKGLSARGLMAELFAKETGCCGGRGGSMHLFAPEVGLLGTSGIVGPCILQAAGAGYSFQLLKTDRVAVAFFGDGAVNNGAFHEGLNMAGVWSLPVLFVCENNQYMEYSPISSMIPVERPAASRASAFVF